jgi:hypothetical protein
VTRRKGLLSTVALAVTGALVGLLVVGCGIRPTGVIHGQSAPQGAVSSMVVYLLDHNTLRAVARPLPPPPSLNPTNKAIPPYVPADTQALNTLLQGPTATEAAAGLTSDIPPNSFGKVIHADGSGNHGEDNVIVVIIETGDEASLTSNAVDQIVCTVITAQLIDGITDSQKALRVAVYDSGNRSRPPQSCPQNTP